MSKTDQVCREYAEAALSKCVLMASPFLHGKHEVWNWHARGVRELADSIIAERRKESQLDIYEGF
jgi:hypothetical protein